MAAITDLPCVLLYHIIFLLVNSSGGAVDLARILSVCRNFLLYAEDEHILKRVNFDLKMEFKKFYRYQHINSLLVKCSEAGNEAARFLLGKVILVSSSQLFLIECQKVKFDVHPCDLVTLSRILSTNVPAQNPKVGAFMSYFSPKQESSSEVSGTRLVHYQLVKMFLHNGSAHDFIEMDVFLKCYMKYFTRVSGEDSKLPRYTSSLVSRAHSVTVMEPLAKSKESYIDTFRGLREYMIYRKEVGENSSNGVSSQEYFGETKDVVVFLLSFHIQRCQAVGVCWQEAMYDVDFLEEMWRNNMSNHLDEAYHDFNRIRDDILDAFQEGLHRFRCVIQEL